MVVGLGLVCLVAACRDDGGPAGHATADAAAVGGSANRSVHATSSGVLIAVPTPELARADETARAQMTSLREQLDGLDATVDAAARAQAFGDLGSAYLVYDFLDAARACFANARTLAPDDFRWGYLLGYVHQLEGQLDEAVPLLESVAARAPDFVPALLRLGRAQLERGDLDAASSWFQQALDRAPDTAAALEGMGKVASARDDVAGAIDYLEQAVARQPRATSLNYALAQLYRKQGNLDRAESYLASRGDVAVRIDDPLLNPLGTLGQSVQLHLMQGAEAMEDGDYETAAGAYQQALDVEPTNFTAYRGLSYAVEKLGDLEGAIGHLTAALDHLDPSDPSRAAAQRAEAQRILGGLHALAGNDAAAIAAFESALATGLGSATEIAAVRLKLANALARQRRYDDALVRYDAVLEAELDAATRAMVWERRATALVNLGRGDDAVADFERAIAAAPDNAALRMRYADALAALGRAEAAEAVRGQVAEASPDGADRARLLAETGRRLLTQGQFQAAVDHFDGSLNLDPDQHAVRNQLAQVLGHLGYFDDALREFRAVIEAAPRHAAARQGEITVLLLTEQFGVARMRLQDALRTFPLDADLALTQALLLATCADADVRDGDLALEIARRVRQVRDDALAREVLAVALAAAGRFDEAAALQSTLVAEAKRDADAARLAARTARLDRFARGEVWTAESGQEIVAALRAATTQASTSS